ARALVQRAQLAPESIERYGERIVALAGRQTSAELRAALAQTLLAIGKPNAAVRRIAAAVAPAIAADRVESRNDLGRAQLQRLLAMSGDHYLVADAADWHLPPLPNAVALGARASPAHFDAPEPGLRAIYDAVPLGRAHYLIALGEAGAAVID